MTATLHDYFDVVATAIATLTSALQKLPATEEFLALTITETVFVLSQINQVKPLINKLFKYRSTLLRNINLRISPVCKLPPETLSQIFTYACHPGFMVPTKIGAVCSQWRQVAWSSPQLWTELDVGWRFWESSYRAKLLDLYCNKMGGLHYSITLRMPSWGGYTGIPFQDVFEQIFIKHPDRLKTLNFEESPKSWIMYINHITECGRDLPNLESLTIANDGCLDLSEQNLSAFYRAPRLTKLDLADIHPTLAFPWARITQLALTRISSEAALQVVLQCENLVTLKLEDLLPSSEDESIVLPDKLIVLRNLQTFEYKSSHMSPRWEQALTGWFWFTTSLEKMVWLTKDGAREVRSEFLLHLPISITDLWIDCRAGRDDIQDLKDIFARLTSLRVITLYLEDPLDLEVMELFATTDEYCLLPSLRRAELWMMRPEYDQQQIEDILNMARSRWAMRSDKAPFEDFVLKFWDTDGNEADSWFESGEE